MLEKLKHGEIVKPAFKYIIIIDGEKILSRAKKKLKKNYM